MYLKTCNIILLIFVLSLISCDDHSNSTDMDLSDWKEDIEYLSSNLKNKHINLFHRLSQEEFDSKIQSLIEDSSYLLDYEIAVRLLQIFNEVGDSHTAINASPFVQLFPFNVELLEKEVILSGINSENSSYLGHRIERINAFPIGDVIDSLKRVIAYENEHYLKVRLSQFLAVNEFLTYFSFKSLEDDLTIEFSSGEKIILNLDQKISATLADLDNAPLYLKKLNDYYWFEEFSDHGMLYIQYSRAKEMGPYSFSRFTDDVITRIEANQSINKVLIDLRLNPGGNSSIARPLINALNDLIKSDKIDSDEVFIAIGKRTYSSAVLNAIEFKETLKAKWIGEPSGGKPNHFGEVRTFTLPNSGILVYHSTKYFNHWHDDLVSSLAPDIIIHANQSHILNGEDPVFNYVASR